MSAKKHYIDTAYRNEKFLSFLHKSGAEYTDWMAAAAFYSAWHFVGAYLVAINERPPDAHLGDRWVTENPVTAEIFPAYKELKDQGFNALYARRLPTMAEIDRDVIPQLNKLKNHILANLP